MEYAIALITSAAVLAWTVPDIALSLEETNKFDKHAKIAVVLGGVCVVLSLFLNNPYAAVLSVILAYLFSGTSRKMEERSQSAALDAQIGTALQIVSSLYEATGNLIDVLAKTAECIEDPLSYELKKTVADYQKGMSLKGALQNLTKRVPSKDLQIFVSGVLEAEKFGTNPGDVISAVVTTINDRLLLNEELKNEMKGQKTTIYVMLLLLPLMAGMSIMLFPQCKEILTQTIIGKLIICGIFFIEYFVWAFSAKGEVQREW